MLNPSRNQPYNLWSPFYEHETRTTVGYVDQTDNHTVSLPAYIDPKVTLLSNLPIEARKPIIVSKYLGVPGWFKQDLASKHSVEIGMKSCFPDMIERYREERVATDNWRLLEMWLAANEGTSNPLVLDLLCIAEGDATYAILSLKFFGHMILSQDHSALDRQ
ncbi:hypothetical protein BGZ63DRAFT_435499 [Mariannaea sp. PMI_226]|nr:hypothetical protein BGZ63DRAFT_435499 [Mariannaea sp. PMI_226]